MNGKKIDPNLQIKIKNYLEYQYQEKSDINETEVTPIIDKLSA